MNRAMNPHRLSKSRYISGMQCHRRLWYDTHARELAAPVDDSLQAVFDTGHEVGEIARERFPGGHLVAHDHLHIPDALEETRRVVQADAAPVLFEAAFEHERMLVRADVLERLPGGGWRLVEVKSTTRLKEVFILDVAVQLRVLRGAGIDVREAGVLTLNREYVYDGVRLDLDALFKLHPVLDEGSALLEAIGPQVQEMQEMLAHAAAPHIAPSSHCFTPYACRYYEHCTRNLAKPEHGLDELPRLTEERRTALEAEGIGEIRDILESFPLTYLQRIVRRAVHEGRARLHGDVARALSMLVPPVRYLDFETFAPAIPRFAGTRPYEPIPFLFSVHTEDGTPQPRHEDYLHDRDGDPRPPLAERLIHALGRTGSICTYSGYERQVIRALAKALPHRAEALAAIEARLFDLLPVVRNAYYHPEFRGSFSIKNVLPILVPGMDYEDLAIADGQTAAARYQRALASADSQEGQTTFDEVRAYCGRDTLAMVHLRKALAALGRTPS